MSTDRKIDYDRGVLIRTHNVTGMEIFMYKDTPGVYLNAQGKPVPVKFATEAGFDTEMHLKAKHRGERLAQAARLIDQELATSGPVGQYEEVSVHGNYKVMRVPKTMRHFVTDETGTSLTPGSSLDRDTAQAVAIGLAEADGSLPPGEAKGGGKEEVKDGDVHGTSGVGAVEHHRPADSGARPNPRSDQRRNAGVAGKA